MASYQTLQRNAVHHDAPGGSDWTLYRTITAVDAAAPATTNSGTPKIPSVSGSLEVRGFDHVTFNCLNIDASPSAGWSYQVQLYLWDEINGKWMEMPAQELTLVHRPFSFFLHGANYAFLNVPSFNSITTMKINYRLGNFFVGGCR